MMLKYVYVNVTFRFTLSRYNTLCFLFLQRFKVIKMSLKILAITNTSFV